MASPVRKDVRQMGMAQKNLAYTDMENAWGASPAHLSDAPATGEGVVMLLHPSTGEELKPVAGYLRQGRMALVNLEQVPSAQTKRMVDFLGGVAYGLNCRMQRVARSLYLLLPASVLYSEDGFVYEDN